jgi:hypothetical protein
VFNQALAINTFGANPATGQPLYHQLTVDAFADQVCSPYATPQTIATNLKNNAAKTRSCYSWYGPNQPGVNETDPSNPSACVPDPGAIAPGPYHNRRPTVGAPCKLPGSADTGRSARKTARQANSFGAATAGAASAPGAAAGGSNGAGGGPGGARSGPPINLGKSLGQVISTLSGARTPKAPTSTTQTTTTGAIDAGSSDQTQQLLNYLLAP